MVLRGGNIYICICIFCDDRIKETQIIRTGLRTLFLWVSLGLGSGLPHMWSRFGYRPSTHKLWYSAQDSLGFLHNNNE
jgi:hypothetical protein